MTMILVVDDVAFFRDPVAIALRKAGYRVQCATGGQAALDNARQQRPDLMLLDLAMPEMDGLAVIRAMQADPHLRDVPVIVLTALTDKYYVVEAERLGVTDFMLKTGFSLSELLTRVKKRLEGATPSSTPRAGG